MNALHHCEMGDGRSEDLSEKKARARDSEREETEGNLTGNVKEITHKATCMICGRKKTLA